MNFEINNYVKKLINAYLAEKNCDLRTAMFDEHMNKDLAAILHKGFPALMQKFYPLAKFEAFLWEKHEFLFEHIEARLLALDKPSKK